MIRPTLPVFRYRRLLLRVAWPAILMAFAGSVGCSSDPGQTASHDEPTYPALEAVQQTNPGLDALIDPAAQMERIAGGFEWSEGPVWRADSSYLLFSDIPKNTIYKWTPSEGLRVFLRPAGYTGSDPAGEELGTNGLAIDNDGRLLMADHGNHAISRLNEGDYTKEVLVDAYKGRRLNSPNDLVVASNGDIYFTDPPYGLGELNEDPRKALDFNGVYVLSAGELTLLTDERTFPNGIALSPDEQTLYVAQSDPERPLWMAYDVRGDGTIGRGRVFYDGADWVEEGLEGLPDGMAVDKSGHIFATGPGGVHIFSPDGVHLGTVSTPQPAANCTFGGPDGSTLFITSDMYLYRIQTKTTGVGWVEK